MTLPTPEPADMYIGGAWRPALSGQRFLARNPATLEPLAALADGGRAETCEAIQAAHAAFPAWAATPVPERSRPLQRTAELILAHRESLARTLTRENGKPLAMARLELESAAGACRWYAEEAWRIQGRTYPAVATGRRTLTLRQPVGVVAALVPFNFPADLLFRKLAPAVAAGCSVVVRPARATSLITVELFRLLAEAGLPPGVVNLVTGRDAAGMGEECATNPRVRKLTFTGSTAVGKELLARAAGTVKHVSLELGGQAPFLVFEDADLERAAAEAAYAGFRNSGQVCISANRLLVQRPVVAPFLERLADHARALRVGNGLDPDVEIGPLIGQSGFQKVAAHVEDARARGASVVVGGRVPELPAPLTGYFYPPTVLADVTPEMRVMREETFGPVLPVLAFDTEAEALTIANDTPYGLAAYFFTRDASRLVRVAERLEAGILGANTARPAGVHFPFGGIKQSGLGRENGSEGIEAYLETKSLTLGVE